MNRVLSGLRNGICDLYSYTFGSWLIILSNMILELWCHQELCFDRLWAFTTVLNALNDLFHHSRHAFDGPSGEKTVKAVVAGKAVVVGQTVGDAETLGAQLQRRRQ